MSGSISTSKLDAYNVLSQSGEFASKIVAYNVLAQAAMQASKLVSYAVLVPVVAPGGTGQFLNVGMI